MIRKAHRKERRNALAAMAATLLWAAPVWGQAPIEARPEIVKIGGPIEGLKLGLLHFSGPRPNAPTVLVLHGQVVPHEANLGFPIGGHSLLGSLAASGLDVWALDYYGFGVSDRYPEMSGAADAHAPLGNLEEVTDQVASAVKFLRSRNGGRPIMLVGDSRGSEIAGAYAARQPGTLSKLVLYGPVTAFTDSSAAAKPPAYTLWTAENGWAIFSGFAQANPDPDTLDPKVYDQWAKAFLDSDPTSRTRNPPSVKIPNGGALDLLPIARGQYVFDASKINVPTLLLMGETDQIATFPGAQWLLTRLRNAPHRRLVVIGDGSHTVQFEKERDEVYKALAEFLHEPG